MTLSLTKKGERTLERLKTRAKDHEAELDKLIGASKGRLMSLLDKIITGNGRLSHDADLIYLKLDRA